MRNKIIPFAIVACVAGGALYFTNTNKEEPKTQYQSKEDSKVKLSFENKTISDMQEFYTEEGLEFTKKILPDTISSDFAFFNVGKSLDKELKNFKFTTASGKTIELSSLKGKKVLLDFALTSCGTCQEETNFMSSEDFESNGIEYLHIFPNNSTAEVKEMFKSQNAKFNEDHIVSLTGLNGFKLGDMNITNVPSKIFINEEGIVTYAFVGGIRDKETLTTHTDRAFNPSIEKMLDFLKEK